MLRTYGYDSFGNRTHMTEGERETAYTYNAMNQLMSRMDSMSEETYAYDRRGNLSLIMENGSLKNSYTYGALNRLEQAVNGNGEAATYEYNGLGHRVGKVVGIMKSLDGSYSAAQSIDISDPMGILKEQSLNPETKIRYTIDLTRGYHNLLEKEEAGSRQTYLWDGNVAGMREEKNGQNGWSNLSNHPDTAYYLQDELGSPIRLLDEEGNMRETYGYDEFGQDLYRNQGQIQPFGYTGYQSDRIAGTYYAQAREYRAELGRFAGVDIIKGFAAAPYTLNEYGYCWGNPEKYVDNDGQLPTIVIGALVGAAIGGVGSIVSDVVSGNDIDWGKAGRNTLKGAAAGAIVGTGIGAVGAAAAAVPGATAATVAMSQTTYCITTAIAGTVSGISNCLTSPNEDEFSNFMNGVVSGVTGNTLASILPFKMPFPIAKIRELTGLFVSGFSSSVELDLLNAWDKGVVSEGFAASLIRKGTFSGIISTIFGVTGMKVLEAELGKNGAVADSVIIFFDTIYAFLNEGISSTYQEEKD